MAAWRTIKFNRDRGTQEYAAKEQGGNWPVYAEAARANYIPLVSQIAMVKMTGLFISFPLIMQATEFERP